MTTERHTVSTRRHVGILGTGQMASALSRRLMTAGYDVTLGSRSPHTPSPFLPADLQRVNVTPDQGGVRDDDLTMSSNGEDIVREKDVTVPSREDCDRENKVGVVMTPNRNCAGETDVVTVTSREECVRGNDVIFVALHADHFPDAFSVDVAALCAGKILIDVSNRTPGQRKTRKKRTKLTASSTDRGGDWGERTETAAEEEEEEEEETEAASNADLLASLAPVARVVKAFNSISAYVMENDVTAGGGGGGARVVAVAGDDVAAREAVRALARDLGFEPLDAGGLGRARAMEDAVLTVLPEWRGPAALTGAVVLFWLIFSICRFYWADSALRWDQLPLKVGNKVVGATAMTLLALTYLPGSYCALQRRVVAAWRGRRRNEREEETGGRRAISPLPRWLQAWLRGRRQLGLLAFLHLALHVLISSLVLSPAYVPAWFPSPSPPPSRGDDVVVAVTVPILPGSGLNVSSSLVSLPQPSAAGVVVAAGGGRGGAGGVWVMMTWVGELSLLLGVLTLTLLALLAVTSLPSVSRTLNWGEWRLLHSRLGHVALLLAVTHVAVMGAEKWLRTGFPMVLFRVKFLSVVLPTLVLVFRLLLALPSCPDRCSLTAGGRLRRRRKAQESETKA